MDPKQNVLGFPKELPFSSVFAPLLAFFLLVQICVAISAQQLAEGQRDITLNAPAFESKSSLYVNSIEGIRVRYPVDWEKVEFAPGISEGPHKPVVNFVSPSRGPSDLFREYLLIESVNLTSNHPSLDSFAAGEIQYLRQSFPGFSLVQYAATRNATSYPAHELVYTYTDPTTGNDKAMEVLIVSGVKGYVLSYHAATTEFSSYLPTVQEMIDSFKIIR
jgi:hypothetical protein